MATCSDLIVTKWAARFKGRHLPCSIGYGGIGQKQGEGDGITPAGVFEILNVYVRPDRSRLDGHAIRLGDIWSDDPRDPHYNTLQAAWAHPFGHERLRRADPLYDAIADLSYNRGPIEPGKGSAIFMHIWRKPRHPTEGCVAFSRQNLEFILTNWTARSRVIIRA